MENLTIKTFKEKIMDFENNDKEWEFKGKLPAIIDFYADWCNPCKILTPILEELSLEFKDKINIYKINTEQEQELSAMFGIRSIPSILFIPMNGEPQMTHGALPKSKLINLINEILI